MASVTGTSLSNIVVDVLFANGTGTVNPSLISTAEITLPFLTLSGTALDQSVSSAEVELPKLRIRAVVDEDQQTSLALPLLGLSATCLSAGIGLARVTLPDLGLSGASHAQNLHSGSLTLPKLQFTGTSFADGDQKGPILAGVELDAQALTGNTSRATVSLPWLSLVATDTGTRLFLPAPTLSATGYAGRTGSSAVRLPALSLSAATHNSLTLPALKLSAAAIAGFRPSIARVTLPGLSLVASAEDNNFILPMLTLIATGTAGSVASARPRLRAPTLAARTFSGLTLPALAVSAASITGAPSSLVHYLPRLGLDALASGEFDTASQAQVDLPRLRLASSASQDSIASGLLTLRKLALAARALTGAVSTATLTIKAPELAGSTVTDQVFAFALTLPSIRLIATSTVAASTAQTGGALVMNVQNKAHTTFSAYGFNSFCDFGGMTLAASPTGLYAIGGDTDAGVLIDASIKLGKLDLDSVQLKIVDMVHAGYSSDGTLQLNVQADDGTQYSYDLETWGNTGRHTSRVKVGKGLKGRYFQWGVNNVAGADFTIDTIEPDVRELRRRVR